MARASRSRDTVSISTFSDPTAPERHGGVLGAIGRLSRRLDGDGAALADLAALSGGYARALGDLGELDHVTLLPNRLRFLRHLAARRDVAGQTLVLLTLADAKHYNELLRALGQGFGDDFVRAGARSLVTLLPRGTEIHHVSVLSFAMLVAAGAAEACATELAEAFRAPLTCEGIAIPTRVGIGLLDLPVDLVDPSSALRSALAAAQDSRSKAAGWSRYDRGSDEAHLRSFSLVRDLALALKSDDQLHIQFQPRVELADGRCECAEVLLRWRHPSLGPISPAEFIPLAEATALIEPVTDWVLDAALRQSARWARESLDVVLSVNVSALNLRSRGFDQKVADLLEHHAVPSARIELEVTEGAMTADDEPTSACIAALAAMGVDLAIDDFGTGYSNMGNLAKLPAKVLKIDRSFVRPLEGGSKHSRLVRSIITMAHDLGYRVVAEGIETQGVYDLLAAWNCDQGQGFFMSRPLPPQDFVAWQGAR
jgi:EAL domain-containing protein (putative c-di-GMP-specific phosphodiesterase class I)/GGDEF domain-containing protein